MPSPIVAILVGSRSDLPVVEKAAGVLGEFGVPFEIRVLSAHRNPAGLEAYLHAAEPAGVEVFICAAGMAAHLAGAVAARTTLPVIGVPLAAPSGAAGLGGLDALLATVQMPPGIPVATVAVDGAKNAAYLAVSILGLKHPELAEKLRIFRRNMTAEAEVASVVDEAAPVVAGPAAGGQAGREHGPARPSGEGGSPS